MIRAGPPLKNALNPSSRSVAASYNQPVSTYTHIPLTYLLERIAHSLVRSVAGLGFRLQTRLDDICIARASVNLA